MNIETLHSMANLKNVARNLVDRGISVVPVLNKDSSIGGAGWQKTRGEDVFSGKVNKAWNIADGLGLICGEASGIICLDIDILENSERLKNVRRELLEMLPPALCSRIGNRKKPAAILYAYNGERAEKWNNISVELLGTGNQVVLPPSLHPTGVNYEWRGNSLEDIDVDELPELPEEILVWLRQKNNEFAPDKSKGEGMEHVLSSVPGRCKSGSHNYLSAVGVAMRHDGRRTKDIVNRLLELDLKINGQEDSLYFRCSTRKEWRSADCTVNALAFVKQIEKNHKANPLFEKYTTMGNGFYFEGKEDKNGKKTGEKPDYLGMAKYFRDQLNFKCDDTYRCVYRDGYFHDVSKEGFSNLIDEKTKWKVVPGHIENFKKKISSMCFFNKNAFEPKEGLINLANGVLDIKTNTLSKHSPKFNFRYRLDHDYDKDATCLNFTEFLDFVFQGDFDLVKLIGEVMGYTIVGGTPTAEVAFIFYGDGRNGKSTLLKVIRDLLGKSSVSAVSMSEMNRSFSTVRLDGKLANIKEESPACIDSEAFKNITGGGEVTASKKNMDEFDLEVKARLFFACNDYPRFKDGSVAIKDRLVIFPFNRYIKPEERDPEVFNRIKAEMPGILNFALEGYQRFREDGFTKPKSVEASVDEYLIESDPVRQWFDERIAIDLNMNRESHAVLMTKLFNDYCLFCTDNGLKNCTLQTMAKRIKRIVNQFIESKKGVNSRMNYDALKHKAVGQGLALRCVYIRSAFSPGTVG